jgi:hypothetical protein
MRTLVPFALLVALLLPAAASAGTAPNRLDANTGAVVSAPRIHNLYWDDNWDAHHPSLTRASINTATGRLGSTSFMNAAAQYGVGNSSFSSSHQSSFLCGAARAPNTISTADLIGWITCMVNVPGTGVPFPGIRAPISNDLYMVYLPRNTKVVDDLTLPAFNVLGRNFGPFKLLVKESCVDYGAYHAFSAAVTGLFAWAVMPTRCDPSSIDALSTAMSHEAIEATTDPFPGASRIDNSISISSPGFARLLKGEASDICSSAGAAPAAGVRLNGTLFAPYWSNSAGACRPAAGVFRLRPRSSTARAGQPSVLSLTWTTPGPWRKLRAIDLRFLRGKRLVGRVRLTDDGSPDGRLSASGRSIGADLAAARVTVSRNKRRVTLRLPVSFAPRLAGRTLRVEASAREDRGLRQEPARAGTVHISG